MSPSDLSDSVWPPKGWKEFSDITLLNNQTIFKDPHTSKLSGLCYSIEPIPVFKKKSRTFIYNIAIESWEYSINNESSEFPVLSFLIGERYAIPQMTERIIENIKSFSRPIESTPLSSQRSLMAALFFIKQINNDYMPDIEKTLSLYKIHPSQRTEYQSMGRQALQQQPKNNGKNEDRA